MKFQKQSDPYAVLIGVAVIGLHAGIAFRSMSGGIAIALFLYYAYLVWGPTK